MDELLKGPTKSNKLNKSKKTALVAVKKKPSGKMSARTATQRAVAQRLKAIRAPRARAPHHSVVLSETAYSEAWHHAGAPPDAVVPPATSSSPMPDLRTIGVHAATGSITTAPTTNETSLFEFGPHRIINPLRLYQTASSNTTGRPLASVDWSSVGIVLDRDLKTANEGAPTAYADWRGRSPFADFHNTDGLVADTYDTICTASASDPPLAFQSMYTEIYLEIACPENSTCTVWAISPGDIPEVFPRQHERLSYETVVGRRNFGSGARDMGCIRALHMTAPSAEIPAVYANRLVTPTIVGSGERRIFRVVGAPQQGFLHAGVLSEAAAADGGAASLQYGYTPRNNLAANLQHGMIIVQNSGACTMIAHARAVLRIEIQNDDGSRSVPTLASAMKHLADPTVQHLPSGAYARTSLNPPPPTPVGAPSLSSVISSTAESAWNGLKSVASKLGDAIVDHPFVSAGIAMTAAALAAPAAGAALIGEGLVAGAGAISSAYEWFKTRAGGGASSVNTAQKYLDDSAAYRRR